MGQGSVLLAVDGEDRPSELAHALTAAGIEAAVGDETAASVGARSFDAIFVSLRFCAGEPSPLARALAASPGLEVLVTVPAASLVDGVAALRVGATDLVLSPAEDAAVVAAAQRALSRARSRRLASELLGVARLAGLGQLCAGLAHDIANPVAVLASSLLSVGEALDLLGDLDRKVADGDLAALVDWWRSSGRRVHGDARETLHEATLGADRLKILSRDLRAMARADPASLTTVTVREAVDAALRMARAELTMHAHVAADVAPDLAVIASPGALVQVLVHLLTRAAHAVAASGRRRGHVVVRSHGEQDEAVIAVEDGVGPTEADALSRALAPLLPAGAPPGPSSLGLTVARDLVERMGGTIAARATASGGTVFEVRLRRADARGVPAA
jgi:C4-dicarboxylate-specific signal transduction histidine kinase